MDVRLLSVTWNMSRFEDFDNISFT